MEVTGSHLRVCLSRAWNLFPPLSSLNLLEFSLKPVESMFSDDLQWGDQPSQFLQCYPHFSSESPSFWATPQQTRTAGHPTQIVDFLSFLFDQD